MTATYYVWYMSSLILRNKSFFEFFKDQFFDEDYMNKDEPDKK